MQHYRNDLILYDLYLQNYLYENDSVKIMIAILCDAYSRMKENI